MNKKIIKILGSILVLSSIAGCKKPEPVEPTPEKKLETTKDFVEDASKMTLAELEEASKKEMEASKDTFKVVGLTSVLSKVATTVAKKYSWIKYSGDGKTMDAKEGDNTAVKNDYKDYALLTALEVADDSYFADYALVQDVRSIADYDGELLHNYIPSDWKEIGLKENDLTPLKGVAFNKLFWTNSNFENVTGLKLYNIWQLAGAEGDKDHITNVSFQSPATEQINMSFLLSCYAEENQARIKDAYKKFYGKDWSSTKYENAGAQWVNEFVANISRWHSSDGTAMKETQLKDDWKAGFVYYGAFAKMKDAVGKYYTVSGQDSDPILKDLVITEGTNAGKICAMDTVKWDWEIEGFNGFYYNMCSQIVNNAKHPYTACLFARTLLTLDAYSGAIYNKDLPAADGTKGTTKVNQYGYYFPASNELVYAKGDWNRDTHIAKEIVEDYAFLKGIRVARVNEVLTMMGSNTKAKS